jgi:hypothetical protein
LEFRDPDARNGEEQGLKSQYPSNWSGTRLARELGDPRRQRNHEPSRDEAAHETNCPGHVIMTLCRRARLDECGGHAEFTGLEQDPDRDQRDREQPEGIGREDSRQHEHSNKKDRIHADELRRAPTNGATRLRR